MFRSGKRTTVAKRCKTATAALCLMLLGACVQTGYDDYWFPGGEAKRLDSNTFKITGRGNIYTSEETKRAYAMLKAAETTLANGAEAFQIVKAWEFAKSNAAQGYMDGYIIDIRLLRDGEEPDPERRIYDARKIKEELTPVVLDDEG